MKSKDILIVEAKKQKKIPIISNAVINKIHNECHGNLQEMKVPLYRGLKFKSSSPAQKVKIRTNRIPRDSLGIHTAAFNYVFEKASGEPMIRNRTTFVTSVSNIAGGYGDVALIFPIDGTQFLRSTSVSDLYSDMFEGFDDLDDVASDYADSVYREDPDGPMPKTTKLVNAASKVENKIESKEGRITADDIDKLLVGDLAKVWEEYVKPIKKTISSFYLYDGYHKEFATAKEEIQMFDAPYYYAVNIDMIEGALHKAERQLYSQGYKEAKFFVGDKEFDAFGSDLDDIILDAIKNKKELYALGINDED